ncbi:MAG: CsbD family protein [Coriobacteriia bacterium]
MPVNHNVKHASDKAIGKVKETVGEVADNQELEAKGRLQGAKGKIGQVADDIKEAAKDAVEDVKHSRKR